MIITTPEHLALYTKCPELAKYNWNQNLPQYDRDSEVIRRAIKKTYYQQMKHNRQTTWRAVPGFMDLEVSRLMAENKNYEETKSLLVKLHNWYHHYYVAQPLQAVPNLPVIGQITCNHKFQDVFDIVAFGETISLIDIRPKEWQLPNRTSLQALKDDMSILARIYLFDTFSGTTPHEYMRFLIFPQTVKPVTMKITKDVLSRARQVVKPILKLIEQQVFYPNFTDTCKHCEYDCKLNK